MSDEQNLPRCVCGWPTNDCNEGAPHVSGCETYVALRLADLDEVKSADPDSGVFGGKG